MQPFVPSKAGQRGSPSASSSSTPVNSLGSTLAVRLSLLQRTQRHRGTRFVRPEAKAGIQRFSERCVEGVEVDQRVGEDSVEGQRAGSRVHIHRHSVRGRGGDGGGGGEVSGFVIVPHRVTDGVGADQTPGLIVPSEQTLVSVSSSADSSVSHRYMKPPAPLHLPVTAASQTISTQQLRPVVESVWMVGVRLSSSTCDTFLLLSDSLIFRLTVFMSGVNSQASGGENKVVNRSSASDREV